MVAARSSGGLAGLVIPTDPIPIPTEPQRLSVAHADRRINIWEGSIRSGKTVASVIAWLAYVAAAPPGELAIIGKTERTVARNILPVIGALVPYKKTEGGILLLGRMVWIIGANDEGAEGKLRGMTLAGAYVDEATLVPLNFWKQLLGRLSVPGARLLGTTNPDSPHHWLLKDYLENPKLAGTLRRFTFRLADATYLDPDYVAALIAENTGLWYRRFILGEWVAAEGAIYELWEASRHVRDVGPPIRSRWVALDYGTNNPFHALLMGRDAKGAIVVEAEWRFDGRTGRRMSDAQYADALIEWATELTTARAAPGLVPVPVPQVDTWVVDPSAASFITELRNRGLYVKPANNEVADGIRRVTTLLGRPEPGLYVASRCAELIVEIEGYVWDPKAQLRGEDKPLKVNDHGVDALRYGVAHGLGAEGAVVQVGSAG